MNLAWYTDIGNKKQKAIFLLPTAGTSQLRNHLHVPSPTPATSCRNTLPNCTLLLAVEKTAIDPYDIYL
ncbi:hypothetical protein QTP88_022119 [Uroleucon formosanum]